MYETFHVHRRADRLLIGSVSAASETDAVYRLVGGSHGRSDFYAVSDESRRYHQDAARNGGFRAAPFERD